MDWLFWGFVVLAFTMGLFAGVTIGAILFYRSEPQEQAVAREHQRYYHPRDEDEA